jgi:hypothetical protein
MPTIVTTFVGCVTPPHSAPVTATTTSVNLSESLMRDVDGCSVVVQ